MLAGAGPAGLTAAYALRQGGGLHGNFCMIKVISVSTSTLKRFTGDVHRKPILLGALLVLAVLLLYGRVTQDEFLALDDGPYVTRNVHVNTGLNRTNVAWAFTGYHESNWHPLTWISHMADCQFFGLHSGPHHFVNVVLHAANVLLLFWLLKRGTGAVWRSFMVSALFAVHPLNVETVAWVAQRKSLLCTLFSLLTIAAYGGYVRRPDWKRYVVVIAVFSLALMSKPMAVSLPFVLLLIDYWPLQRSEDRQFQDRWLRLSVEKLPLVLMSAGSSALTVAAQRSGGAVADSSAFPLSLRIGNAILSYAKYIGKTIWPARLAVFYPHPQQSLPSSDVIAAAVILVVIAIAAVYFRSARYFAMGWFLFVITLIPVIGIVQVGRQAMADRYAYVPDIGLFIIIVWGLGKLVESTPIPRVIAAAGASCLILVLAVATIRYLPYWRNGVTLLTHAAVIAGKPDPAIEEFLADELTAFGRMNEAYRHYGAACVLLPKYATCHFNMAEILFTRYQLRDALAQYQLALSLTDSRDMALSCLIDSGQILLELGDYAAADMRLASALQIDPYNSTALALRQRVLQP